MILITSCKQNQGQQMTDVEIWKLGWRMILSSMEANYELMNIQFDSLRRNVEIIGDDWTDEYMFEEAPDWAYTIKVGFKKTKANFQIQGTENVRELLNKLSLKNRDNQDM